MEDRQRSLETCEYFTVKKSMGNLIKEAQICFTGEIKFCNQKAFDKAEDSKELDSDESKTVQEGLICQKISASMPTGCFRKPFQDQRTKCLNVNVDLDE